MLETPLKKLKVFKSTCSIDNLKNNSVTFIRNEKYLNLLKNITDNICVVAPKNVDVSGIPSNVEFLFVDDPDYVFTVYHNEINKDHVIPDVQIGKNCMIHETVVMNVEGFKVANVPDGSKIQFKHTGNIIIRDNVEIGPYCVVHRGTMGSTIIKDGVKIGAMNNIAHNNVIGEDTVFAVGSITNGSVTIGKNCWISSGSCIKNGINICDNVVIGMGAVVTKNITKSGIYAGVPAKYIKQISTGWNF